MGQNRPLADAIRRSSVDVDDDYGFRDFVESITVTKDELAAIVSSPGYSIPEIREYLRAKPGVERPPVGAANRSRNADPAPAATNHDLLRLLILWARLMRMAAPASIKKLTAVLASPNPDR